MRRTATIVLVVLLCSLALAQVASAQIERDTLRRAAGGWSNDNVLPEHRYLNVTGGFLAVTAERRDGTPTLILHHYSVDGEILNEEVRLAE